MDASEGGKGGEGKEQFAAIAHSTTHPKFLHSNSTSHVWAFGAIAELADNSLDAGATKFSIDLPYLAEHDQFCLTLEDNGDGMSPDELHRMLSFGHCEKLPNKGQTPIGRYGNGFKSGSMRLGKDALVFTISKTTRSIGFLSQTFLHEIEAVEVLVPMMSWDTVSDARIYDYGFSSTSSRTHALPKLTTSLDGAGNHADKDLNLEIITRFSPFKTLEQLNAVFEVMPTTGTRIVIFNLKSATEISPNSGTSPIADKSAARTQQQQRPSLKNADGDSSPSTTTRQRRSVRLANHRPIVLSDGDGNVDGEDAEGEYEANDGRDEEFMEEGEEEEEEGNNENENDEGQNNEEEYDSEAEGLNALLNSAGIEFDLSFRDDIQLVESVREAYSGSNGARGNVPTALYSLREYMSILYCEPRMQIWIRNARVQLKKLVNELYKPMLFTYGPKSIKQAGKIDIVFGFNKENKEHYGMMLYHNGRLINLFLRVGLQLSGDSRGVGVIGVAHVNFLEPTHNKQGFICNDNYRFLINALKERLTTYWGSRIPNGELRRFWDELRGVKNKGPFWACCDNCFKWRKIPKKLPAACKTWICGMNVDKKVASCAAASQSSQIEKYKKKRARRSTTEIEEELVRRLEENEKEYNRRKAKQLAELRLQQAREMASETGFTLAQCKKALAANDGDMERAEAWLNEGMSDEEEDERPKKRKRKSPAKGKRGGRRPRKQPTQDEEEGEEGEAEAEEEAEAEGDDEEEEEGSEGEQSQNAGGLDGSYWSRPVNRKRRRSGKLGTKKQPRGGKKARTTPSTETGEDEGKRNDDEVEDEGGDPSCIECVLNDSRSERLVEEIAALKNHLKKLQTQLEKEEALHGKYRVVLEDHHDEGEI